ncbi:hypothetical protein C1645_833071 [Glomus cerebriforme]|uniref:Uncharacterized protein n=1 Tax=Glomus cerebriforme TaxID=658196 RepID=A0A397SIW2_9GLOM|nr:hypothetical protein C1645_833071 [Glomus cerebriforme]
MRNNYDKKSTIKPNQLIIHECVKGIFNRRLTEIENNNIIEKEMDNFIERIAIDVKREIWNYRSDSINKIELYVNNKIERKKSKEKVKMGKKQKDINRDINSYSEEKIRTLAINNIKRKNKKLMASKIVDSISQQNSNHGRGHTQQQRSSSFNKSSSYPRCFTQEERGNITVKLDDTIPSRLAANYQPALESYCFKEDINIDDEEGQKLFSKFLAANYAALAIKLHKSWFKADVDATALNCVIYSENVFPNMVDTSISGLHYLKYSLKRWYDKFSQQDFHMDDEDRIKTPMYRHTNDWVFRFPSFPEPKDLSIRLTMSNKPIY